MRQCVLNALVDRAYSVRDEPFLLSSGAYSHEYIDCRLALSFPETLVHLGYIFCGLVDDRVTAVGGLTMGADPIAHAISIISHESRLFRPVRWFSIRKDRKGYGHKRLLEGHTYEGEHVAIVEDVVTSGRSTVYAIDRARELGLEVTQVLALVDREEGGICNIKDYVGLSAEVKALFNISEIRAHAQEQGEKNEKHTR